MFREHHLDGAQTVVSSYEKLDISVFLVGNFPCILPRLIGRCALGNHCLVFGGRCERDDGL